MEKFCLILIGDSSRKVESDVLKVFNKQPLARHISFISAVEQPEWAEWMKAKQRSMAGIGEGAAGCLIAHRRAWALLLAEGFEHALILESDARLTKYGKKHLENFISSLTGDGMNIVHCGTHERNLLTPRLGNCLRWSLRNVTREFLDRCILKFISPVLVVRKFPFSTHAYFINLKTARELLEIPPNFLAPIDVLLNAYSQVRANRVAAVRTPLFVQSLNSESLTRKFGR